MIKAIVTDCFGVLYNDILKDMLHRHNVTDSRIVAACFAAAQASDMGDITLDAFFEKLTQFTSIPPETVRAEMSDTSHLNVGFTEILRNP
ncbi:MAG TPA: hypothetical protein VK674_03335 [Candidatus Limnocylindria bacterium]|nr:hypothetical protein [Candidatus Limnocylindria bacterium]